MPNGIWEAFYARMRDDLLNETLLFSLGHARAAAARWVADYNRSRPHSSLGSTRRKRSADRPLLHGPARASSTAGLQLQVDDGWGSEQVECLNFKFWDTSEGEFIETIIAAQGELERDQYRCHVIQKMKARVPASHHLVAPVYGYR